MTATSATTGSFFLELEGQSVPVKSIEGGAPVGVVLTAAPAAGTHFREKHLSGVRFEPIAIAASSRRARPLFDWITTAWQGTLAQKNGAVIRVDINGRPQAKREFVKAILVETTVPMLDGASSNPADFTVRLAPKRTRDVTPPTTLPPTSPSAPGDTPFLSANFRLNIDGLDCTESPKSTVHGEAQIPRSCSEFRTCGSTLRRLCRHQIPWFQVSSLTGTPALPMRNQAACPFSTQISRRCCRRPTFQSPAGSSGWRIRRRTQAALSRSSIVSGWSWQSHPASHPAALREAILADRVS